MKHLEKELEKSVWEIIIDLQREIRELEEENKKLKEYNRRLKQGNDDLKEENKKLKHENSYRAGIVDILPKWKGHIAEETIQDLQARIKELKETIKDHQLYEEKLEHRIIEFEELLHWE